jgi:hypothetical protein
MLERLLPAGAIFMLFALPAAAHHSSAMYDMDKKVTLTGTVTNLHWANPHVWLYMTAPDAKGREVEWVLEGGSTGSLARRGWSATTFIPGDRVKAVVAPLKDGSRGGLMGIVTKDGKEFDGD